MTTLQIDLIKNPKLAALAKDKEPGTSLYAEMSIKSQDAQTLTVRLEEVTDDLSELGKEDETEVDEETETYDETPSEPEASVPEKTMADKLNGV